MVMYEKVAQKDYDAFLGGFIVDLAIDPSNRWGDLRNPFNNAGFQNARVQELLKLGLRAPQRNRGREILAGDSDDPAPRTAVHVHVLDQGHRRGQSPPEEDEHQRHGDSRRDLELEDRRPRGDFHVLIRGGSSALRPCLDTFSDASCQQSR
ncbi:MAG: hypothetical protein IPP94_11515 [Ignavibacteria bacterium]|nr:hypothetical protein [Ignavibacteria bacterium]